MGKVHEANMGPTWGRQAPGGPYVGPINIAIRDVPWVAILSPWHSYDCPNAGEVSLKEKRKF